MIRANGVGALMPRAFVGSVALVVALAACGAPKSDAPLAAQHVTALKVGDNAPRFSLIGLKGDSMTVGDSACREEFAELERLRKTLSPSGLDVVAISVDQGTDVKVRKFVETEGSGFRVAHDADSRITKLYGISGLPTSYLLDRGGRVLWTATGDFRLDSAGLAGAIAKALGQ